MVRELVHPQMLTHLADFYPSLCTIEQDTSTDADVDSIGQAVPDWQPLAGHVDIPCAVASVEGREIAGPPQSYGVTNKRIGLRGYYPLILARMRVVIGTTIYSILAPPDFDSHGKLTRLIVGVVE